MDRRLPNMNQYLSLPGEEFTALLDDATLPLTDFETVPISTVFHAGTIPNPNTLLLFTDGVIFYVHDRTILDQCPQAFELYLSASLSEARFRHEIILLDVPSAELNIILHAMYRTSAAAHFPDIATLVNAVDPISALSHLLSYDLTTITDDMAVRMGSTYLKKLMILHLERHTMLKQILLRPPHPHAPTKKCGFGNQDKVTRTWVLLSAHFVWETGQICLRIVYETY
ncbi:hypothetical protein CPB84DRAFT_1842893 [Gymnopilus junonius]|uniref:BTB domain-containing protein n=1 Tax=Gymnopilus junonius TaxID=109634 RepID=A0A9P5TRK2_GYMJU|nr:hypothetical protein CPB84DRAFT_1842893 [Gymnopilus junonius]